MKNKRLIIENWYRYMGQAPVAQCKEARTLLQETLLSERIDKELLARIPNFEEWKKAGAYTSERAHYKEQLKKKYSKAFVTDAYGRHRLEAEDYKWALEQEREEQNRQGDPLWRDKQAQKLSSIIHNIEFVYFYEVYFQDHDNTYDNVKKYYIDGKHRTEDTYNWS